MIRYRVKRKFSIGMNLVWCAERYHDGHGLMFWIDQTVWPTWRQAFDYAFDGARRDNEQEATP